MPSLNINSLSQPDESSSEAAESRSQILPVNPLPLADLLENFVRQRTLDPICINLAIECDRLDLVLRNSYYSSDKPGETAAIMSRRVSTLKSLGDRLDEVSDRGQPDVEVSAMARVLRIAKEAMRNSSISPETRELIYQEMIGRIQSEIKDKKQVS
jgi:hypothetical protein